MRELGRLAHGGRILLGHIRIPGRIQWVQTVTGNLVAVVTCGKVHAAVVLVLFRVHARRRRHWRHVRWSNARDGHGRGALAAVWGVETLLNQVLAFALRNHWLQLGSGKRVHVPSLACDQQQYLRTGQRGQLVSFLHNTRLSLRKGDVAARLVLDVLDFDLAAAGAFLLVVGLGVIDVEHKRIRKRRRHLWEKGNFESVSGPKPLAATFHKVSC